MSPEAPEDRAPKSISDFNATTTSKSIILTWKAPTQNIKGDDIANLESFIVKKREYKIASENDFDEVAEVHINKNNNYTFVDSNIQNGKTYDYLIATISDENVEGVIDNFIRVVFKSEQTTITITPYLGNESSL